MRTKDFSRRPLHYFAGVFESYRFYSLSIAHGLLAIAGADIRHEVALNKGGQMKLWLEGKRKKLEEAKVGWAILWLLGVPIPVLLVLFLLRGCT
jgi:hypothetical protein